MSAGTIAARMAAMFRASPGQSISPTYLAVHLHAKESTVYAYLKRLAASGLVRHDGYGQYSLAAGPKPTKRVARSKANLSLLKLADELDAEIQAIADTPVDYDWSDKVLHREMNRRAFKQELLGSIAAAMRRAGAG